MAMKLIFEQTFHGRFDEPDYAMDIYTQHNRKVKQLVAPENFLSFHVSEGWQPLCDFLNCDVPNEPFPRTNTKEEFLQRGKDRKEAKVQS